MGPEWGRSARAGPGRVPNEAGAHTLRPGPATRVGSRARGRGAGLRCCAVRGRPGVGGRGLHARPEAAEARGARGAGAPERPPSAWGVGAARAYLLPARGPQLSRQDVAVVAEARVPAAAGGGGAASAPEKAPPPRAPGPALRPPRGATAAARGAGEPPGRRPRLGAARPRSSAPVPSGASVGVRDPPPDRTCVSAYAYVSPVVLALTPFHVSVRLLSCPHRKHLKILNKTANPRAQRPFAQKTATGSAALLGSRRLWPRSW